VRNEEVRPSWTATNVDFALKRGGPHGASARAEQRSHLEVADGQGGLLEQSGQLALDDLGGPEGGPVVNDEDFFMAR
jgi:hypothetical protein